LAAAPVPFLDPPPHAAWQHREARDGFEVAFFGASEGALRIEGDTSAVESGAPWAVHYDIELGRDWITRRARVAGRSRSGAQTTTIESDGAGRWRLDGEPAPRLDGCLDVDLESSALTNAFPVHRLALEPGDEAEAPAAYVRAEDLALERLEQHYRRLEDDARGRPRYHYSAPAFDFECELVYDGHGLVLDYPGIATRVL
jgi:hypothetical protein